MNKSTVFNILYALAALGGREQTLFGSYASLAEEAFNRSLVGPEFPEIWFELPFAGEPWLDLHVLTSRSALTPETPIPTNGSLVYPDLFAWFAKQHGVRQLALSYDISQGNVTQPAAQLLIYDDSPSLMCGFLQEASGASAAADYNSFVERIPKDWFACYAGVFPGRTPNLLRVECIPRLRLQQAYANDPELLRTHLSQVGFTEFGDTLIERCCYLCGLPFRFEMQFNVNPGGFADSTLGASVRFAFPPGEDGYRPYEVDGVAGELMQKVVSWGLADDRWRVLGETSFVKGLSRNGVKQILFCHPTFLKLRWKEGSPLDAKAYLMAGIDQ